MSPDTKRRNQGADSDPGSSQIVDFIDFQHCINFPGAGQNVMNLIRGDCVQAAAKGVQLDQIQTVAGFYIGGRPIQPGVVHPLIRDNKRPLHLT